MVLAVGSVYATFSMPAIQQETNISAGMPLIQEISPIREEITVQEVIDAYPDLEWVMKCESNFRQFKKGKVLRGEINHHDMGIFQINEIIWGRKAKELGYDIYTLKGNLLMGVWIFNNYGINQWECVKNIN